MSQRGFIHHFPLLIVFLAIVAGIFYLIYSGKLNLPLSQKSPKVELQEGYANPFKKETQFVNPFEPYKNPFTVNR